MDLLCFFSLFVRLFICAWERADLFPGSGVVLDCIDS